MNALKIIAAFAMAAFVSTTWAADGAAQASAQAKQQMKDNSAAAKTIKAPAKKTDNMQFQALDEAAKMESKKFDTLSKSSKSRHGESKNAVRNER